MPFKAKYIPAGPIADQELANLNLTPDIISSSVKAILSHKRGMHSDHPQWCVGIASAGEGIYQLRQLGRPLGWRADDSTGLELTICNFRGRQIALNIAIGTDAVCNQFVNVETKCGKGPKTKPILSDNQLLLDFPPPSSVEDESDQGSKFETWYILYHQKDDIVRIELALPTGLSEEKTISLWSKRIEIGEFKLDGDVPTVGGIETKTHEVSVRRRSLPKK